MKIAQRLRGIWELVRVWLLGMEPKEPPRMAQLSVGVFTVVPTLCGACRQRIHEGEIIAIGVVDGVLEAYFHSRCVLHLPDEPAPGPWPNGTGVCSIDQDRWETIGLTIPNWPPRPT